MVEKGRWRDRFHKDEVVQRARPEHTSDYLNNPHKGIATFQRFNGDPLVADLSWNDADGVTVWTGPGQYNASLYNDRYGASTISYCRWAWSLLEPQKGQFRFDIIERALETAAARGQTLQLRTQPFVGHYSCPDWYWALGAKTDPELRNTKFPVPDHNDPLYIQHWGDHIRAMGRRFDGHPALESFDLAYGGGCGETGGNCTPTTAHKLADIYLEAFTKTQLVGMLGTEGYAHAVKKRPGGIGHRFDCYGDCSCDGLGLVPDGLRWNHMWDAYPQGVWQCAAQDVWKTSPVTAETCWTVPHWFNEGWDIDWILDQGLKYHLSVFMPKSVYIPEPWMDKMTAFLQRLGYWYHLHQMILPIQGPRGGTVGISACIDNKGIAPIYRPYRFALRFSQGKDHHVVRLQQDIRKWMPDLTYFEESFALPAGLQPGEAKVSCGIVNEKNQAVVRMAIKAVDEQGWHPLTSMDVV